MKIDYEIINKYSKENRERTVDFVGILINLLEIHQKIEVNGLSGKFHYYATIPFSSLEKYDFNPSETESFIGIINNLKIGESTSSIRIRRKFTAMILIDEEDFKNNLCLEFNENTVPVLKSILKELLNKGYGKKEENKEQNIGFNQSINISKFYIVKEGEDFKYKGAFLNEIAKDTNYYIVFNALYSLLSKGGFIDYNKIGNEIKKHIPKTKRMTNDKIIKFIQRNLTDEHNGFLHYAKIKNSVAGGKKLIHTIRGKGIEFNNSKAD